MLHVQTRQLLFANMKVPQLLVCELQLKKKLNTEHHHHRHHHHYHHHHHHHRPRRRCHCPRPRPRHMRANEQIEETFLNGITVHRYTTIFDMKL